MTITSTSIQSLCETLEDRTLMSAAVATATLLEAPAMTAAMHMSSSAANAPMAHAATIPNVAGATFTGTSVSGNGYGTSSLVVKVLSETRGGRLLVQVTITDPWHNKAVYYGRGSVTASGGFYAEPQNVDKDTIVVTAQFGRSSRSVSGHYTTYLASGTVDDFGSFSVRR